MTRTQVYFDDKHYAELKLWAGREKRRFSEILREIVANALEEKRTFRTPEERREAWKAFIGSDKSKGGKYLSRDIDKILYGEK